MSTWESRVKSRMKELEMTQEQLAKKLGITRGAVTHYLCGRRTPPLQQFQKLAHVLKADPAWLQYGVTGENLSKKIEAPSKPKILYHRIPILTWAQTAKHVSLDQLTIHEYIPDFFTGHDTWYALRVKSDAMVSSNGSKSFYEGDLIIVDPHKEAKHGDFVVALLPQTKEATFKQYVIDSGIKYLKPLNTQYPMITIDTKTIIIGIVVSCIK